MSKFSEYKYYNVTTKTGGSIEDVPIRTVHVRNPKATPYGPTLRELVGNKAFDMLLNSDRGDNTARMLRELIKKWGHEKVRYVFIYNIEYEEAAEGGGFVIED